MRITLVTLIILFLTGCSLPNLKQDIETLSYEEYKTTLPIDNNEKFKLNGKLSLFIDKKGQTGKILWGFENDKDTIHILNPFNTKIAEIILINSEKKVILNFSQDNNQNSDQIITDIFGNKENIFLLKQFITKPPQQLSYKNNILIKYKNWNIYYQGNKIIRNKLLPNTIMFEKNNISLKIFISDWIS
jgi:outer membrane biogenesis lipoprotein LolB